MQQFIAGITLFCFTASYLVTLALEVTRLFFRAPIRMVVIITMSAAGILAHTIYLCRRAVESTPDQTLSSWYDWCLLTAWIVVAVYLFLAVKRPDNSYGLFLLPVVLAMIGLAYLVRDVQPFGQREAILSWRVVHGLALLSGTSIVTLGFAAGLMFLLKSYRLKHRLPSGDRLKLPSLERLQWAAERSLVVSTLLLLLGLVSGIVLNIMRTNQNAISWSDPVVWSSGVLLLWLVATLIFNAFYKPARRGRKVAYLVVTSFIFLSLEIGVVLWSRHASSDHEDAANASVVQLIEQPASSGGQV